MKTKASATFVYFAVLSLAVAVVLGSSIVLATDLTWDGGTGTWNTTNTNWLDGGTPVTWSNATPDSAIFGAGGTGSHTVTLGENMEANDLTFNLGAAHTIAGTDTLTLHGTHVSGTSLYTWITANQDTTIDVSLTSTSPVRKLGTGMLVLNKANSFTTGTTGSSRMAINSGQGVVSVRDSGALGNMIYVLPYQGSALQLQDGVSIPSHTGFYTYDNNGGPEGMGSLRSVSGHNTWAGYIRLHRNRLNGTIGVDADSLTVSGVIMNDGGTVGSLTKAGDGMLVLANANTYSGTTDVDDGVLKITNGSALGDTSAGTTIATGSAKLYLSGDITVAEPITFAGGQANPNSLLNVSGNNTLSGPVTTTSVRIVANSGSVLNFTGGLTGSNPFFVVNAGGEINFSNTPVNLGSGGHFWVDSGGLTVLGVSGNTWGTTTFSNGTMRMDAANALPTNTDLKIGGISYGSNVTTLDLNGFSQTVGRLNRAGTSPETISITSATPATLTANQSATTTYDGGFTGAVALTKSGSGTLNLTGLYAPATNHHTGDTLITGGTLALGSIDLLQNSTLDTGPSGAQAVTFTAAGANTYNLGGLKGADDLDIGANSISIGANGQDTAYSGVIGGSGGLTKTGTGTLTLSGDSTYTGLTTISDGTLQVAGSIDSDVTIDGGWLTGPGEIDGSVTIELGGGISAGASPGEIDILGAYDQSGTMLVEINGYGRGTDPGHDFIDVTGAATLDGTILVELLDGFEPVEGDAFDVLTAAGGIADLGVQVSWTPGQLSPVYYWTHEIINGDTLRLTAQVPEPSTALLSALGLIGLASVRRRKR